MKQEQRISFLLDKNKYIFKSESKEVEKNLGDISIEISEISPAGISEIIKEYKNLEYELSEKNLIDFTEWLYTELLNKYGYPISFFIKNSYISYYYDYLNSRENFIEEANTRINLMSNAHIDTALTDEMYRLINENEFDNSVNNFINIIYTFEYMDYYYYNYFISVFSSGNKDYPDKFIEAFDYIFAGKVNYELKLYEKNKIIEVYSTGKLASIFKFDICNLIKNEIQLKKCANCGRYFIPQKRSDAIYCDRQSPQDKAMTCKEYGSKKLWYEKLKDNKSAKLYRSIYMAKQMQAKRNPDIQTHQDDFAEYKTQSAQWKRDVKNGTKTEEEFIKWLKSVSGRRYLY